jgi:tetratricopeptide (TPR) repeat protein
VLRGRFAEAVPLLNRAARLDPANFWVWWALGNCYDRLGPDARAESSYTVALTHRPDFDPAYHNRGLAHLRQRNFAEALADFDEVLRLRPGHARAHLHRATALQGLGRHAEAVADLTRALELGAPDTRIYFLRARSRQELGDAAGARRDRAEGLRREPTDEASWVTRGLARMAREPQAALADFERALQLNPDSPAALQNKAHVLAELLGRTAEALPALDRAVARYPEATPSRGGRAVLYARLGRRAEALRDADETLLRDTSPPRLYQVACVYALTSRQEPGDRPDAFRLLAAALRRGFGADLLENDRDLDPLRGEPEFRRLRDEARSRRHAALPGGQIAGQ